MDGPATYQRYMNDVLFDYLDDILLIYSEDESEHEEHVKKVLPRLRVAVSGTRRRRRRKKRGVIEISSLDGPSTDHFILPCTLVHTNGIAVAPGNIRC